MPGKLSARAAETLGTGRHGDGDNLYLVVDPSGSRRWLFIYRWRGKRREMGLGGFAQVGLSLAREKATAAREALGRGEDPLDARRRARTAPTFGDLCNEFITERKRAEWKGEKTEANWRNSLEGHAAPLRRLLPAEITTQDVLDVLTPIWTSTPEIAQKTQSRLENVLDFAKVKGWREGDNPARWVGHLQYLLPKRQKLTRGHHPAMPYEDVPAFMAHLEASTHTGALALRFLVLTAMRESVVLTATWSEIDWSTKTWNIPSEKMKSRKGELNHDYQVPLSEAAMLVLRSALNRCQNDGKGPDYIFPGDKPGRPLSNATLDKRAKAYVSPNSRPDATGGRGYVPHGFRSSFRDWVGDATDVASEIAEYALGHVVGGETERAYRRRTATSKRRELMTEWGEYLSSKSVQYGMTEQE